jgi:hypothetical protein
MAKEFSYTDTRENELFQLCRNTNTVVAKPLFDHNGTRMAAVLRLVERNVRLHRALEEYVNNTDTALRKERLSPEDGTSFWETACEIVCLLNYGGFTTVFVQREKSYNGAYGPVVQHLQKTNLNLDVHQIIDRSKVEASFMTAKPLLTKAKAITDFTPAGREVRDRMHDESTKRFGSKKSVREFIACILDLRTLLLCMNNEDDSKMILTCDEVGDAWALMEHEYVEFRLRMHNFDTAELVVAQKAKVEREVASDVVSDVAAASNEAVMVAAAVEAPVASAVADTPASQANKLTGLSVPGLQLVKDEVAEEEEEEEEEEEVILRRKFTEEYHLAIVEWINLSANFDWAHNFSTNLSTEAAAKVNRGEELDAMDLVDVPIGGLYARIHARDKERRYGYLPLMARSTLGNNLAQGYCERIISAGNDVVDKGNTSMSDGMVRKLVMLRMNRDFMNYMRENYHDQVFDKAGSARMGGNQGELRVLHMRRYDSPPTKKVKVDLAKDE